MSFRALAGMLGPTVFIVTFTVLGLLRPDYDATRTAISALSVGPRGWIQIVNFMFLGVTLLIFSRGVAAVFREGKASRAGHVLLAIIAVALFVSGPFVMDPIGTPLSQMTVHGMVHGVFGAVVFSLAPVTCFVFWRRFRSDQIWRPLRTWTLVAAIMMSAAVALLRIATPRPPAPGNALTTWAGLIQRTVIVTFLVWIFAFARALGRRGPLR